MDLTESEMNEMVHAMADVIDRIRKEANEPPIDRNRLNQIIEDRVLSEYGITVVC